MPSPACGRERPKAEGKEKKLKLKNSFADMAAPPGSAVADTHGRQGSAVNRIDGGFACSGAKETTRTPRGGPRWSPPWDDHLPGDEGLPEGSGALGEPS